MSVFKKFSGLLIGFILISGISYNASAQEVSPEELNKFADSFQQMQVEGQQAEQQILVVIQETGLTPERFQEIQEAAMDPEKEVEASEDELKKHELVMVEIRKMQPMLESKMKTIIADNGLTIERYQEIGQALQNSPELQQRFQELMMKKQTQG